MKKTLFQLGPGLHLQWLLYTLLAIALMIGDQRFGALQSLRANLEVVVYPIQYVVNLPFSAAGWMSEHASSRESLIERNADLEGRLLKYRAAMQRYELIQAENMRLRNLLNSSKEINQSVQVAELLSVELAAFKQEIIINQGSKQNVIEGQAVIDSAGIMGQIIRVSPISSTVLLITDPNHAISIENSRTGLRAVAVGTGTSNKLEIRHIPNTEDVKIGDLFISSGLDGQFPANYPVAIITEINHPEGAHFAEVYAEPTAAIDRSREVLLLRPMVEQNNG